MRTLFLIRHAETHDRLSNQSDLERRLTAKGEKDAKSIGQFFTSLRPTAQIILHSPATRTTQTAAFINESLGLANDTIISVNDVYRAASEDLLDIVKRIDEKFSVAALVGHNPAISNFALQLAVEPIGGFSPAMVVALDFDIQHWHELTFKMGKTKFIREAE